MKFKMDIDTYQNISTKIVSRDEFSKTTMEYHRKIQSTEEQINQLKQQIDTGIELPRSRSTLCTISTLRPLCIKSKLQDKIGKLENKVSSLITKIESTSASKSPNSPKRKSNCIQELANIKKSYEDCLSGVECSQKQSALLSKKIQRLAVGLSILVCVVLVVTVFSLRHNPIL